MAGRQHAAMTRWHVRLRAWERKGMPFATSFGHVVKKSGPPLASSVKKNTNLMDAMSPDK